MASNNDTNKTNGLIRLLKTSDAVGYASLRLVATKANPECFCTTVAELQNATIDYFANEIKQRHQLSNNLVIGYFANNQLIGAIGVEQLHGQLRRHKARIWGLMVLPEFRRQGVAKALCQKAIEQAKNYGVEKLSLELTGEAIGAMHLYQHLGFTIETVEPMALKHGNRYVDEIRMTMSV